MGLFLAVSQRCGRDLSSTHQHDYTLLVNSLEVRIASSNLIFFYIEPSLGNNRNDAKHAWTVDKEAY